MKKRIIQAFITFIIFHIIPALAQQKQAPSTGLFTSCLKIVPTSVKTVSVNTDSVVVRRITFTSRKGVNTIYGIIASPAAPGKYPALLVMHGGGSYADELEGFIRKYAAQGYVAMAVDEPGICNPGKAKLSEGAWRNRPKEPDSRFDIAQSVDSSTLVDAVTAGLGAFNLLENEVNVDRNYIGITGFSWGGYMTTMLSGLLGNRVKAAYAVFGCGFYEKGSNWKDLLGTMPEKERMAWLANFDAGRKAPGIKCPYFIEASVNDKYFWPEAVMATLNAVNAPKNLVWGPNLDHVRLNAGERMQQLYFDYYLKQQGQPFGKVNIIKTRTINRGSDILVNVTMPKNIRTNSVTLYYGKKNAARATKKWTPVIAVQVSAHTYKVKLPEGIQAAGVDYYLIATDNRKIKTATYIQ
ncbi:alpha/beta hydrolase family protein [Mucilaginibacter sp.]|jgi:dienelactone hydrolase|uniref:alpha/beta hydrolase family protein n=1 Tax=Mucilaginibacter sp. TaxID=1882438 RepID=UPI00356661FA